MVIAEIIWVLDKYYNWSKKEICRNIELLLNTPNVRVPEKKILMKAIDIFRDRGIDFMDAYNYSFMDRKVLTSIYSYDRSSDSFSSISRIEP